jgi:transcriptional regulator with XRE-family HTH domain
MPAIRELDPTAGPLDFFGAEVRRWRNAAGLSQEQLGQRIGYSGALVGKVETGDRAPSLDFAEGCDRALPTAGGLFGRLYELARHWAGGYPSWFTEWVEAERRAITLRTWQPLLVPGLLQTPEYARALFLAWHSADSDDQVDQLVNARIERQAIFQPPDSPSLWAVLDEGVLRRRIGSVQTMHDQLTHLLHVSERSSITVQVVPAEAGAHVGLLGAFSIAAFVNAPGIVYLDTPDQGQIMERPSAVAKISEIFDQVRAEALPRGVSRDLIRRVAEEQWTT